MGSRLDLHNELLQFCSTVYFQPPSNIQMEYPCIVYTKTGKNRHFADDVIYLSQQGYKITVISGDPDNEIADNIENHFQNCVVNQYYIYDSLNHASLSLYY
jgi:hypothetical protein